MGVQLCSRLRRPDPLVPNVYLVLRSSRKLLITRDVCYGHAATKHSSSYSYSDILMLLHRNSYIKQLLLLCCTQQHV